MTFSFRVVCVRLHKMTYRRVREGCLEPYLADLSSQIALTKKPIRATRGNQEQSFGVQIVCIHRIPLELCMRERRRKSKISHLIFSTTVRRIN